MCSGPRPSFEESLTVEEVLGSTRLGDQWDGPSSAAAGGRRRPADSRCRTHGGKVDRVSDSRPTLPCDENISTSKNQFLLLGVMKGALEAEQKRWEKAKEDIEHIVQTTDDGLDNVLSTGKNGLEFTL